MQKYAVQIFVVQSVLCLVKYFMSYLDYSTVIVKKYAIATQVPTLVIAVKYYYFI